MRVFVFVLVGLLSSLSAFAGIDLREGVYVSDVPGELSSVKKVEVMRERHLEGRLYRVLTGDVNFTYDADTDEISFGRVMGVVRPETTIMAPASVIDQGGIRTFSYKSGLRDMWEIHGAKVEMKVDIASGELRAVTGSHRIATYSLPPTRLGSAIVQFHSGPLKTHFGSCRFELLRHLRKHSGNTLPASHLPRLE